MGSEAARAPRVSPVTVLPLSRRRFSIIIKYSARVADKTLWSGFYVGKIVGAGEKMWRRPAAARYR